ncbi:MAG: HD domain-containing protein [Candidatus Moraniibacteriota bacterium]
MDNQTDTSINVIIASLESKIRHLFHKEGSGHDIYHLKRVLNLALAIQEREGGDRLVLAVAAFLHDLHRIMEKESGVFCPPTASLPQIRELLEETGLTDKQKERVCHCVEFHEEYDFSETGKTAQDIETLILQDADNLDAIGAIGIGRTFTYNGAHGTPMWEPDMPFNQPNYDESTAADPSTIHHFHSKLLKLKDNMNTGAGKRMAEHRHEFMERFEQEFMEEWNGRS